MFAEFRGRSASAELRAARGFRNRPSSGAAVEPVLRWGAETAGADLVRRTDAIRDRILELRLARDLPVGLAVLGFLCAAAAALRMRRGRA